MRLPIQNLVNFCPFDAFYSSLWLSSLAESLCELKVIAKPEGLKQSRLLRRFAPRNDGRLLRRFAPRNDGHCERSEAI